MLPIRAKTGHSRAAFSLVEMMVVIAIITILMALTMAAVMAANKRAYSQATQGTLNKLWPILEKELKAVSDQARLEPIGTGATDLNGNPIPPTTVATALNGLGNNDINRARVCWIKVRQKQAFPQTFAEALAPVSIPPTPGVLPQGFTMGGLPGYTNFLKSMGVIYNPGANTSNIASFPPQTQRAESAICLLMALQRGVSGMGVTAETLGPSNIAQFPTNSGQTMPGLVDAWGMPLMFCRWPTQDATLNPFANPMYLPTVYPTGLAWTQNFYDPVDSQGTLTAKTWAVPTNPQFVVFQKILHDLPSYTPTAAGQPVLWPQSFKLVPIIASSGPDMDMVFGAYQPSQDPRTFRQLNKTSQDNLDTIKGN